MSVVRRSCCWARELASPKIPSAATRERRLARAVALLYHEVRTCVSAEEDVLQALACTLPIVVHRRSSCENSWEWLEAGTDAWPQTVLSKLRDLLSNAGLVDCATRLLPSDEPGNDAGLWHLYELLLSELAQRDRKSSGTFYTPPEIASFVVARVDRQLSEQFALPHGLTDNDLAGDILEPACGSGAFFAAIIQAASSKPNGSEETAQRLVARLIGIDVSPVALFVCRLRLALLLSESGITLTREFPQPTLWCGNALAGPELTPPLNRKIAVVIGNPPFSSLSRNEHPWIQRLIRGDETTAGYFSIDDQQLGERKTWLHDDYVKFLRLSQWCLEQSGSGVMSLVTNHGWLDNATFRIARQQLLRALPNIEIVDLHGNFKKQESPPAGIRDENVFGLSQGISIVTAVKPLPIALPQVTYAELWGSRADKLAQLAAGDLSPHICQPALPWFTFVPQREQVPAEYLRAPLLTQVMPVHSTVPVTARDHFVIARTREELLRRIELFVDSNTPDELIRAEYFHRTRSTRYSPGDTRSWKLTAARRLVRDAGDPNQFVVRCLYRPFVWRYIFWHPAMIDWPREELTRPLVAGHNLTLLARRQSVAGKEANFFWITDCLPIDGVIRSDNRGSESFFPLWLDPPHGQTRRLNLSGDCLASHNPAEFLAAIYALFHSPTYRTRYANGHAMEFPRVLLPRDGALFSALAKSGQQLIDLHLTDPHVEPSTTIDLPKIEDSEDGLLARIEDFQVGTYRVCRKWLEIENETRDSAAFLRLQQQIAATLQIQQQIDLTIDQAGGFSKAF
ncbi:type ISP restriction/modification enzyme [Anatilimnocola sp. NA78]|uniref:type ISP restriction/modification enzyme n=1 Tax=Anatilimnocola sp. NA78 TaxID=3415683 RepID=UPI003CE5C8E6